MSSITERHQSAPATSPTTCRILRAAFRRAPYLVDERVDLVDGQERRSRQRQQPGQLGDELLGVLEPRADPPCQALVRGKFIAGQETVTGFPLILPG